MADYIIKIKKVTNNIINEMKNKIYSDLFISRMIHSEHCIYKHKSGKKVAKFCCKKITINGDKDNFVCRQHNRKHKPKTKKVFEKENTNTNINIFDLKPSEFVKR